MGEDKEKEESLSAEEILREADMIEKEIENNESPEDIPFPEDLDEKVMEKIRLYEESLDEKGEPKKKDNLVRIRKKRPKVFLLVAVITVLVFAFGINCVGSVPFFTKKSSDEIGDREMEMLDTNKETNKEVEDMIGDEEKAFQEIEDTFGVVPVSFGYTPEHMVFKKYDIDKNLNNVDIIYKDCEYVLDYQIFFYCNETVRGYDIDEENIDEENLDLSGVKVKISKSRIETGEIQYKAQFTYSNVHYILNAVMDEEEFYKIIENLIFM